MSVEFVPHAATGTAGSPCDGGSGHQAAVRRILFVDDESHVLGGLRRMLRSRRSDWSMTFATDAADALDAMDADPYDVIVSDLRMPGMDGVTLLERVAERHPRVVRILLSGHAESSVTRAAVDAAHQFLSKPTDADVLKAVIDRACAHRSGLAEEVLARVVRPAALPCPRGAVRALIDALADDGSQPRGEDDDRLERAIRVVACEPSLAAGALRLSNSAFCRRARRTLDLRAACAHIGADDLEECLARPMLTSALDEEPNGAGGSWAASRLHARATSHVAAAIAPAIVRQAAWTAGLVHRVAWPLIGARSDGGISARASAALLAGWGVPAEITECAAHWAAASSGVATPLTRAVCGASRLVDECLDESERPADAEADRAWLDELPGEHVTAWRALAARTIDSLRAEAAR